MRLGLVTGSCAAILISRFFRSPFPPQAHGMIKFCAIKIIRLIILGLITLAKVMKIEIGGPNEFDRPSTQEEALDRLERSAGCSAQDAHAF